MNKLVRLKTRWLLPPFLALLVCFAMLVVSARGQGFVNLDFESAYNLLGNPPKAGELVSVTNALPGWIAYDGESDLSQVFYGSNTLSYASGAELEGGSLALNGDFSVGLYSNGSITQTGLVPSAAGSLQFEASSYVNLLVTLGDERLSYSAVSEGSDYTVYEANISTGMDGQLETLTFSLTGAGESLLDNIQFLPASVPEPSECALIGLGVMAFGFSRLRKA